MNQITSPTAERTSINYRFVRSLLDSIILALGLGLLGLVSSAQAASITMKASDAAGVSSFNAGTNWTGSAAPASGNNYFTGAFTLRTSITAGTYTFAGDSLSIDSGGVLLGKAGNGSTITLNFTNGTGLFLNGGSLYQAGANSNVGTVLAVNGTITANANTTSFLGALGATSNNSTAFETLNILGNIGGSGNITIGGTANNGANTGVVKLSGANTISGIVSVVTPTANNVIASATNRLLQLNNLNALQNATLTLTGGGSQSNLVSFASGVNTGAFNVGMLAGSANQALADTAGAAVTLSIGGNNSSNTYSGILSGVGALTKVGTGTLTLTGVNTYTGATTISAGTLAISTNVQNLGSSAFTVSDGAGLSVKAVASNSTVLTSSSLTLGVSGSTSLAFDLSGFNPTSAQISTGALSLNGAISVNLLSTSGLVSGTYKLIDYSSIAGGSFSNFATTSFTFGHSSGVLLNNTTDTSVDLGVTADSLAWSGAGTQTWSTAATNDGSGANDWSTKNGHSATNFWVNDAVEFNDTYNTGGSDVSVANRTVTITGSNVTPSGVTFNNSNGDYLLTGSYGIAGSGKLVKNGTGKLTLSGSNSYTGGTTINGGTIVIGSANNLGDSSGVLTLNGGTLETTANISTSNNITVGSSNGTMLIDPSATYTASGLVSGSGALIKSGSGTLVLTSANTYSGGTVLNSGTLQIAVASSGNGAAVTGTFTVNGGELQLNATGANSTYSSTIKLNSDATISKTGASQINQTGIISGSGNTLTAYTTASRLYLGGTVTGINQINITGGAIGLDLTSGNRGGGAPVNVANGASLYWGNSTNALANNITLNGGAGQSGVGALFNDGGTGSPNLTGTITLASGTSTFGGSGTGTVSMNGNVTGSGGMIKIGTNPYRLSNNNDYSGGTTISGGVLIAGSNAALGSGGVAISAVSGAQLQLASGVNVSNALVMNGGGVASQGSLYVPTGDATYSGSINITGAAQAGSHFASGTGNLFLTGPITASTAVGIRAGTVVFSNTSNSFSTLTVLGGTAKLGASSSLPTGATVQIGTATVELNAVFDLGGYNQTLAGITKGTQSATVTNSGAIDSTLTMTGTSTYAGVIQDGATNKMSLSVGSGALTLSGTNTYTGATNINGGTLTVNGTNSGSGTVTVASGATLNGGGSITGMVVVGGTLSGSLTLNGDAQINTGASAAAGAFNGNVANNGLITSNLVIGAGKTLSGSGTNSGTTSITGGTLSPGNGASSTATMTLNNSVMLNSSAFVLNIDGATSDQLTINGALDLSSGNDTLTLSILNPGSSSSYTIATYTGVLTGTFADISTLTAAGYTIDYGTGSNSAITVVAVPEPSTWAMMLGGIGMLRLCQKRRNYPRG